MTNEEAIKRMKWTKGRTGITSEEAEAIGYAIEKLSNSEEDCISRKAVLDLVEDMTDQFGVEHRVITEGVISMLPPVTPKTKTDVLGKIRAEIEEKARPNEIGGRGNGKSIRYGLCMALQIIDKYKAESEDKE